MDESRSDAQTFLIQAGNFQTSSVNLDAWEPSCDGCDRPSISGRGGNGSSGGEAGKENGPCSVTGVLAGLGRIIGVPIWPLSRCVSKGGNVGVPGPP